MTTYPLPPFTPSKVPVELRPLWWTVVEHLDWLVDWFDGDTLRTYPLELTTGHDLMCTARYDSEGICHELNGCALVGRADDWLTLTVEINAISPAAFQMITGRQYPCTCRYGRAPRVMHGIDGPLYAWDCWCSAFVFTIDPACYHHCDAKAAEMVCVHCDHELRDSDLDLTTVLSFSEGGTGELCGQNPPTYRHAIDD